MEILNIVFSGLKFIWPVLCIIGIFHEHFEHKKRTGLIKKYMIDNPELEYLFSSLEETSHSGLWFVLALVIPMFSF